MARHYKLICLSIILATLLLVTAGILFPLADDRAFELTPPSRCTAPTLA
jgi:hypothetical protein